MICFGNAQRFAEEMSRSQTMACEIPLLHCLQPLSHSQTHSPRIDIFVANRTSKPSSPDIYSIRILCAAQKSLDAQMIHGRLASNPNLVKDWVNGPNGQWASPLCDPNILVGGSIECVAQKIPIPPLAAPG